ncbi:MAG: DUF1850 domain-containing protein [Syntrophomonadaceae bacterium]
MNPHQKWLAMAATGIIIIILGALWQLEVPALVITEQHRDNLVIIPLYDEHEFTYGYIHSVQKTPVQEHFVVAPDDQLLLTSTTYQSFGVGLPFLPEEGKLSHINGKYVLEINRRFDKVNIGFIPLACQKISYDGRDYDFNDYFKSGAMLEVRVEHYSPLNLIWHYLRRVISH